MYVRFSLKSKRQVIPETGGFSGPATPTTSECQILHFAERRNSRTTSIEALRQSKSTHFMRARGGAKKEDLSYTRWMWGSDLYGWLQLGYKVLRQGSGE